MSIKLFQGDCLEQMKNIGTGTVDMVLADPPYGTTQCKWDSVIDLELMWKELHRIVKKDGAIVLFGAEPFSSHLRVSNLKNYKYDWVWDKGKGMGFLNAKRQPLRYHEFIHVFYQKQCLYNPQKTQGHKLKTSKRGAHLQTDVYGEMKNDYEYSSTERYPRSIQEFKTDTQSSSLHPTQKPVALCEYLISTYTNKGDTVLDFCMGSGTSGVAAKNLQRDFIGIEQDGTYFDIAEQRINSSVEQPDIFEEQA